MFKGLRLKLAELRQPSLKLKAQQKKSRVQVDKMPPLGTTPLASPLTNTSLSTACISRIFVGSNRKRRLMESQSGALLASSMLSLVRPVAATSKVRVWPKLFT